MTLWIRRTVGLTLVLLTVIPFHRMLLSRETGLAGRSVASAVAIQADLLWSGLFLLAIVAMLAGLFLPPSFAARVEAGIARALRRPSLPVFAVATGLASAVATAVVSLAVFEQRPNLVDALLQLMHARYLAEGSLGGPAEFAAGFWHMQNSTVTDAGWFSQYPPGHSALLALGFRLGGAWLVGPVVMGATASLSALVMDRLLPGRAALARAAGLAVGVSPFLIAPAATYMNHATAALLGVLGVYAALRADETGRGAAFAALAGAAVAALSAVRPLAAVVTMLVVSFIWIQPPLAPEAQGGTASGSPVRRLVRRGAFAVLAGLPIVALQLWYNRAAFGGLLAFGYSATWGPSHDLGFHRDPWGNLYGPMESVLYTAADLAALNLSLLETLLPHVTLAGAFLLMARALAPGERVLALWAVLPVAANAFYWHHGQFMGPRMLVEFAPPWIGLSVVAVHALVRRVPRTAIGGGRFHPAVAASSLALAGAAAFVVMAPQRLASYGGDWLPVFRAPAPPAPANSLVFIHGPWESRLISRLASGGMRLDSVETALRQNPACLVQQHLAAWQANGGAFGGVRTGAATLAPLDLASRSFEFLPRHLIARGVEFRLDPGVPLTPDCLAELRADRFGAVDASFVLWLGDLPGIERGDPMYARDLGPAANRLLMERYPDRSAWVYGYFAEGDSLRLLPYAEGSAILWGADPR